MLGGINRNFQNNKDIIFVFQRNMFSQSTCKLVIRVEIQNLEDFIAVLKLRSLRFFNEDNFRLIFKVSSGPHWLSC